MAQSQSREIVLSIRLSSVYGWIKSFHRLFYISSFWLREQGKPLPDDLNQFYDSHQLSSSSILPSQYHVYVKASPFIVFHTLFRFVCMSVCK